MTASRSSLTDHADWAPVLMGEALLFGLLGRVLYTNPAREWLEPLATDGLFDDVPFAGSQDSTRHGLALLSGWAAAVSEAGLSDEMLKALRVDFAHLFVGERRMAVPAWESVYFSPERLTFQDETVDVRRWYERFGVQPSMQGKEPEDHIAFELSFVAYCAERAVEALESGDESAFGELLAAQRAFLEQHLLRWGWKWAELARDHAATDFYRGLALLVRGGLLELSDVFGLPIQWETRFPGLLA